MLKILLLVAGGFLCNSHESLLAGVEEEYAKYQYMVNSAHILEQTVKNFNKNNAACLEKNSALRKEYHVLQDEHNKLFDENTKLSRTYNSTVERGKKAQVDLSRWIQEFECEVEAENARLKEFAASESKHISKEVSIYNEFISKMEKAWNLFVKERETRCNNALEKQHEMIRLLQNEQQEYNSSVQWKMKFFYARRRECEYSVTVEIERILGDINKSENMIRTSSLLKPQREFWNNKNNTQKQWLEVWVQFRTDVLNRFSELESCWKSVSFSWR